MGNKQSLSLILISDCYVFYNIVILSSLQTRVIIRHCRSHTAMHVRISIFAKKTTQTPGGDFLLIVWQVEYSTTATCDTRMMTHVAAHFAELDGASADGAGDKVVPLLPISVSFKVTALSCL